MRQTLVVIALLFAAVPVIAQTATGDTSAEYAACASTVNTALASLAEACAAPDGYVVCLAAPPVEADVNDPPDDLRVEAAGDTAPIGIIEQITVAAPRADEQRWGVARLDLRLNAGDEVITALAFGEATLQNTGDLIHDVPFNRLRVITAQGVNLRTEPDPNGDLIAQAYTGDRVLGTGITDDGAWVRVQLADGSNVWAVSSAFAPDDLAPLANADPDVPLGFSPMQAFTLITPTLPDDGCPYWVPNGVLIQTPSGFRLAQMQINDLPLSIYPETTLFVRQPAETQLAVTVIAGSVDMTTAAPLLIEAGSTVTFIEGAAPIPIPYDYSMVARLPLESLPQPLFAPVDFDQLMIPPLDDGADPLEGLGMTDDCTIAALLEPVNLRDLPSPVGRVRFVMPAGASALPDARAPGADGALWWRLAPRVWVSSQAVGALGDCGTLPVIPPRQLVN